MHATFVHMKNVFRPNIGRESTPLIPGKRIRTILKSKGLINTQGKRAVPFIVQVNGKAVLEKQWGRVIRDQDVLSVAHLPRGGNGGSNPLQIVAMIAVIIIAIYAPYAAGFAYGTWQAAAISSAVMLAGGLLINMLFKPASPSLGQNSRESASPTYTLSAQGNTARLMEAIPVLYGRQRLYPDFAASPYSEVSGNDEYLYQLFCVTQGECSIEAIQLEDTPITSFDEVEYQIVNPNEQLTLFPSNVITNGSVSNLRMYGGNEPEYALLGPYVANGAGTPCNAIGIDISMPNGGMHIDDLGKQSEVTVQFIFEYQLINDAGAAIGPWTTLVQDTLIVNTATPQRYGYKVSLPTGRYQIRGSRTNNGSTSTQTVDVLYWNTLRAYIEDDNQYGAITLLAVKMKATNQLSSQNSRKVNVIATRKLQTWDPVDGWSVEPVATSNPAWAFADMFRNPNYGRNLPDSRLNLAELYRLAAVWDSRTDQFNGVFDTTSQLWDAAQKVAKVGRAQPMYYAGLIDIIRNEPKSLPVAMFSPANMVAGSFSTTYQFADVDTPDHVIIEYIDSATWATATVKCVLPGGTENNPANVQLFGVTNRDQAWREGITMAAVNRDQRRLISLTTEMEGYIPKYADLCQVSHDVPAWGSSGRVMGLDSNTKRIDVSEPFDWSAGAAQYVIAFRKRDGSADGPYVVTADPLGDQNVGYVQASSAQLAAIHISDGVDEDLTVYQFGPTERAGLLVQAMSAQPSDNDNVQMTFVNYADSVFLAESGGVVPIPPPVSNLPTPPQAPIIDKVTLEYTFISGQQTIVATKANGAQYYEFQASPDSGQTWIKFGTSPDPHMVVALNEGTWRIRVRGVGILSGPWTTIIVDVTASTLPLVEIGVLTASTDVIFGITTNWTIKPNNGGIAKSVELWHGLSNDLGNAVKLGEFPVPVGQYTQGNMGPGEVHWYWARAIDTAGRVGPWYNDGVGIVGNSSSDTDKIIEYLGGEITESMLATELQTKIDTGADAAVQVEEITTDLAAMYTIKTQLTVDGKTYIAGVGVGVENDSGVVQSQVLVSADRFAIIQPTLAGAAQFPFIVQGGVCYISSAFIQNASITNAKISGQISSDNYVYQTTGWSINKTTGEFQMNGSIGGQGRSTMLNQGFYVYDANGVERTAIGYLG